MTFAHILHNVGFSDAAELSALVRAWRNLYELIKPDMIVFDHCPLGLLAARGLAVKRVLVGTGFTCPPDEEPLPVLRSWVQADPASLLANEQRVLTTMNQVLSRLGQPPLARITQMYAQVDSTLLTTFRELDHYPQRPETPYWGGWSKPEGAAPQWPAGQGQRVFGYFKRSLALPGLLATLRRLEQPTIAYVDGLTDPLRQQFNTATLKLEGRPLDLQQVGQECDVAILNGGHGASITMLLAGKPILQMPIYLEQAILARTLVKLGMGLAIDSDKPAQLEEGIRRLGSSPQFTLAAQGFAVRYGDFDPAQQQEKMLRHVLGLLESR